jgi:hypothetical protein
VQAQCASFNFTNAPIRIFCQESASRWRFPAGSTGETEMTNARRITVAGALLIGAGVLVIVRQILTAPPHPQLGGLGQWIVGTEFPGPIMIGAGALLWCVAAIVGP